MEKVTIEASIDQVHVDQIYAMVSKVPEYDGKDIESIEKLPGGLTNENFKVTVGGSAYAVRVAGKGTAEMIDRPAEDNNAHIMAKAGINPTLYYYDSTTGDKIDAYIDGKTLHVPDFSTDEADNYISMIAKKLYEVHNTEAEFMGKFDFFDEVHSYIKLIEKNNIENYEGHDKVMEKLADMEAILAKNPRPQSPTHNDPLPENWIVKDGEIFFIDWEYGGIGDPLMDLAAFSLEVGLTDEQEQLFLNQYFGREVTDKEYAFILIDKFVNDVLWYLWSPIQIFNGKEKEWYWNYGLNRFNRCVELMNSDKFKKYTDLLR
ncbi:MAG: phosphotransferase family protein [Desulfobacteraceae bacterium]|nr:phosphotransferase family protein [Desulfobacteraceae bacterium]